jgi:hypothetical protein
MPSGECKLNRLTNALKDLDRDQRSAALNAFAGALSTLVSDSDWDFAIQCALILPPYLQNRITGVVLPDDSGPGDEETNPK